MCGIAAQGQSRHPRFSDLVSIRSAARGRHAACAEVSATAIFVRRGAAIRGGSHAAVLLSPGDAWFYGQSPSISGTLAAGVRALHDLVQVHNVIAGAHHGRRLSQ